VTGPPGPLEHPWGQASQPGQVDPPASWQKHLVAEAWACGFQSKVGHVSSPGGLGLGFGFGAGGAGFGFGAGGDGFGLRVQSIVFGFGHPWKEGSAEGQVTPSWQH